MRRSVGEHVTFGVASTSQPDPGNLAHWRPMPFRFVGQPFPDDEQLGTILSDALLAGAYDHAWIATAWTKQSGLSRIAKDIERFRAGGGFIEGIVGVDEGGATTEGLRLAIQLFDKAYVFHDPGTRTFHPKIYAVQNDTHAVVVVGSGNLTRGGLYTNYEGSSRRISFGRRRRAGLPRSDSRVLRPSPRPRRRVPDAGRAGDRRPDRRSERRRRLREASESTATGSPRSREVATLRRRGRAGPSRCTPAVDRALCPTRTRTTTRSSWTGRRSATARRRRRHGQRDERVAADGRHAPVRRWLAWWKRLTTSDASPQAADEPSAELRRA